MTSHNLTWYKNCQTFQYMLTVQDHKVHNRVLCFWLIKAGFFLCLTPLQTCTSPPERPFQKKERKNDTFGEWKRLCWAVHKSIALKRELVLSLSPERKCNSNWQNKVRQLTVFLEEWIWNRMAIHHHMSDWRFCEKACKVGGIIIIIISKLDVLFGCDSVMKGVSACLIVSVR